MKIYNVELGQFDLGYFVAEDGYHARDLAAADAGYKDEADMLDQLDWAGPDLFIVTEII